MIFLLLLLLCVGPSSVGGNLGLTGSDGRRCQASHQSVLNDSEKGRRASSSRRKLREEDPLNAHVICVDDKETVLFVASEVGAYDGVLIHLQAVRMVDDSGSEGIRLSPKLIDVREAEVDDSGIVDLQNQKTKDKVLNEYDQQILIRKLAMTRGVDLMTMSSQSIPEDDEVEFVLVPGLDEVLLIKGRLEKGRDGKTRLNLGHPYVRQREERKELLEALGVSKQPE